MEKVISFFKSVCKEIANDITMNHDSPAGFVEVSIEALANDAVRTSFDSSKTVYADRIMDILKANWDNMPDYTKAYAIKQLTRISNKMVFESSKSYISKLISKIAIGKLN